MSQTIVVTGGGSGGHITPILAVAAELKHLQPNAKIVYIGQIGDKLADLPAKDPNIDEVLRSGPVSIAATTARAFSGNYLIFQLSPKIYETSVTF